MKLMVRSRSTATRLTRDMPGRRVSFILIAPDALATRPERSFPCRRESASWLATACAPSAHHLDQLQAGALVTRPEPMAIDPRQLGGGRTALQRGEFDPGVEVPEPQRAVRW